MNLLENDKEYNQLIKSYSIKEITINQFKIFIENQNNDENYIYEFLSLCIINSNLEYKRVHDANKKELNILLIDSITIKSLEKIINNELNKCN